MSLKLFFFICLSHFILALSEIPIAKPGCSSNCGNITIPYPFGIGKDCFLDSWAEVECNTTFNPPKVLFTENRYNEIVQLSATEVYIKNNVSAVCYYENGSIIGPLPYSLGMFGTPFFLSPKNKFFATGCGMLGSFYLFGQEEKVKGGEGFYRNFSSGCANFCDVEKLSNCEMPVLSDSVVLGEVKQFDLNILAINNSAYVTSPCGYTFLAAENYNFNLSEIDVDTQPTIGLTFIVGNQTCEDAVHNRSFACKENSHCINSNITHGYTCSCYNGYEGNPYLAQGCQDINECKRPDSNSCTGKCFNTRGSYRCFPLLGIIILGLILALLVLLGTGLGIYGRKRAQLSKLRVKFFQQNGGFLLQDKISMHVGGGETTKIFTAKELKLATNNYEESRVLGEGGFGKVYKGVLPDLRVVAIKKSKIIDKDQLEQFINEVDILTQINHRNIVKLLGCCLEIELPLLVYEFVSNGTLSEHISKKYDFLHWEDRLRIAAEVASALAYLHFSASLPIIHRDVKSANILLDEDLTAKVADFGASRVNPLDETQISTLVKGTLGYLDPEYMLTNQLTQKSDVYSFGVVLAELLTGEKPLSFQRSQEEKGLAMYFTRAMKEKRLLLIIQDGIVKDENINQVYAVAELATKCLHINGEQRPSMKEVAAELEGLRGFDKKHLSSRKGNEGHVNVTFKQVERQESSSYSGNTFEYTGVEMVMPLKDAR